MNLKLDQNGVLKGFCLGYDGMLHDSQLALGDHLENDNGIVKRKKNRSARNWWLDDSRHPRFDLKKWDHSWNEGIDCWEITESWTLVDEGGNMVMQDP